MQGTSIILCCRWRRLSLLFYKTCDMIRCIIDWMFKKFPLEVGGGGIKMGKSTYAAGSRSTCKCAYKGGKEGQIFAIVVCTY